MSVTRGSNRGFSRRVEREHPGHDTLRISVTGRLGPAVRGRGVERGHDPLTLGSGAAVSEPGPYVWERQVVSTGRSTIRGSIGMSYDAPSGWSMTGMPSIAGFDIVCVAKVPGTLATMRMRR